MRRDAPFADARFLPLRCLQEAADGAGDVDVAHAARDHRRDEKIFLEEIRKRLADTILVAGDDRRMRDRQAERVAEQSRDREPVGEAADHRGFRECLHISEARPQMLEGAGGNEDRRHHQQQAGGGELHAARAGLDGIEAQGGGELG
jgi:hypothetical protein